MIKIELNIKGYYSLVVLKNLIKRSLRENNAFRSTAQDLSKEFDNPSILSNLDYTNEILYNLEVQIINLLKELK